MTGPDDESNTDIAWRDIVANFGERARLGDEDAAPEPPVAHEDIDDPAPDLVDTGRFRPPPAPPLPRPRTWQRGLSWTGVLGAPTLAVLVTLLQVQLPALLGWGAVLGFVGGFVYLAVLAPRSPRDPWDDGSRV